MTVTIYHNARCSNARGALELIRAAGIEPRIVDYLVDSPARDELAALIAAAGIPVRDAMRTKDALYAELGLGDAALDDGALLDAMAAHPALINRPFVVTPLGTRLCRPPELVLTLLPQKET